MHAISHRFRTIFELLVKMLVVDRRIPLFNALVRGEPLNSLRDLVSRNQIETSFYVVVQSIYLDILNRLGVTHECQTYRWADRHSHRKMPRLGCASEKWRDRYDKS